ILLYQGYRHLLTSQLFEVKEIVVIGNSKIGEREIKDAVGQLPTRHALKLDLHKVEERLKAHLWVKDATVRRKLPHTLVIEMTERSPLAIVKAEGFYLVDDEGVVLNRLNDSKGMRLPLITGIPEAQEYEVGQKVSSRRLALGLQLLKEVTASSFFKDDAISRLDVAHPRVTSLYTAKSKREIRLGESNIGKDLARLQMISEALAKKGGRIESIDLSFKDKVVVKPRTERR
ncbi:MAG: FtsQ-type POTRA domain-containing protein, partial [Candidatus Tectomicrobia bacterium]|nr:FtsQ-type POTRA domain-containing protein [Candidatus Tectomicrobia bacterium]